MHVIRQVRHFQHLKKDFYRQDVQSSSRQHFTRLSAAVDGVVDACEERQSSGSSLHPALLRCFTAVMRQRCVDGAEDGKSWRPRHLARAQFVLSTLRVTNADTQVIRLD